MRSIRSFTYLLLVLTLLPSILNGREDDSRKKLCWAHNVSWSICTETRYDQCGIHPEKQSVLMDRVLDTRNIFSIASAHGNLRKSIDIARLWGIDGFMYDVCRSDSICSVMRYAYRAAEGTDFKIALCLDLETCSVETMVREIGNFIKEFGNHPNNAYIDNRMVIFMYALRVPFRDWQKVHRQLKEKGLDAYYLIQPARESSLWDRPEQLKEALTACDGFYDFGCNGFTQQQMIQRFKNGRAALAQSPKAILAAGITPGYYRAARGMYRPFLNTGTMRQNWTAALAVKAEWVTLTTWNDIDESTHFAPSAVNRTALLRINQEFLQQWRNEKPCSRTPEVQFHYHEEILAGDDLTLEVLNFSYDTPPQNVSVRLLNEDGSVFHQFKPWTLRRSTMTAVTLRLTDEELKEKRLLRVQAALGTNTEPSDYYELYPIIRRYGSLISLRTVRIPFREMVNRSVDLFRNSKAPDQLIARINAFTAAGTLELLRNGFPIWQQEVVHLNAPTYLTNVSIPPIPQTGSDVFLLRFSDYSGYVRYSNPVLIETKDLIGKSNRQPLTVTGSDFDEHWPLWKAITRFEKPKIAVEQIPESNRFFLHFDFTQPHDDEFVFPVEGWRYPFNRANIDKNNRSKPTPDPNMKEGLLFDGSVCWRLPGISFPCDAFTLKIKFRREKQKGPATEEVLFIDGSSFQLKWDARGIPSVVYRTRTISGKEPVPVGRWTELKVVNNVKDLSLYVDGKLVARGDSSRSKTICNSGGQLGFGWRNETFHGRIATFELDAGVVSQSK